MVSYIDKQIAIDELEEIFAGSTSKKSRQESSSNKR
jgi:hypothetical protein